MRLVGVFHRTALGAIASLGVAALALSSCSGNAGTRAPQDVVVPQPPVSRAETVAVAGDSPAELRKNLDAAQASGRTVRIVSITTPTGEDLYSPYAQVVRSESALIVRAYGRIQVYRLNQAQVAYPRGTRLEVSTIPQVVAPALEEALRSGSNPGVPEALRLQMCRNCAFVLVRPKSTPVATTLWASAKDPWQVHPDYHFWKANGSHATGPVGTNAERLCYISNACGPSGYSGCPATYRFCGPSGYRYYAPRSGASGGTLLYYSQYFGRRSRFNQVAEGACTTQHGRWVDTDNGDFYCRHSSERLNQVVVGPGGCGYLIGLPANTADQITVVVDPYIPNTLASGGSTHAQGVRIFANNGSCYWFSGGPNPAQ